MRCSLAALLWVCNPLRSPWSPTLKVQPFQTAGHGRGGSFPRGIAGLSQYLGHRQMGTTIHAMGTTDTTVQVMAVAVLGVFWEDLG